MFKHAPILAVTALSIMLTDAQADNRVVVLPNSFPSNAEILKIEMWELFTQTISPGDDYTVINGTNAGQIAQIAVPDDDKYKRVRRRMRAFGAQNARIGDVLNSYQKNAGSALIDIPGIFRNLGDNRLDNDTEIDLLIVGNPIYLSKSETYFSMRNSEGAFQIASDTHILASLAQSPYGTAGRETGLQNTFVHFCAVNTDDDWNSAYSETSHRFWSLFVKQQGGALVTWTDNNIKACFKRFKAKARNAPKSFSFQKHGIGLAMVKVSRNPVKTLEPGTKALKDIAIDEFNVFVNSAHPWISGVQVVTGIKYRAQDYPQKFAESWCYFNRLVGGAEVKINVGSMNFGGKPIWHEPSKGTLNSAKISRTNVIAARKACQFPVS